MLKSISYSSLTAALFYIHIMPYFTIKCVNSKIYLQFSYPTDTNSVKHSNVDGCVLHRGWITRKYMKNMKKSSKEDTHCNSIYHTCKLIFMFYLTMFN